jgi:hypothetical protein
MINALKHRRIALGDLELTAIALGSGRESRARKLLRRMIDSDDKQIREVARKAVSILDERVPRTRPHSPVETGEDSKLSGADHVLRASISIGSGNGAGAEHDLRRAIEKLLPPQNFVEEELLFGAVSNLEWVLRDQQRSDEFEILLTEMSKVDSVATEKIRNAM